MKLSQLSFATLVGFSTLFLGASVTFSAGPFQATGIKIGEVTDHSAIIWTRLTLRPKRNPSDNPMVEFEKANPSQRNKVTAVIYPPNTTVADLRDAAPGTMGEVSIQYRSENEDHWKSTPWKSVHPKADFTRQFVLQSLKANTAYKMQVKSRASGSDSLGQALEGRFRTAASSDQPARVVFAVSTGQAYRHKDLPDGYKIYPQILKLNPDFFVHTGDILYYDNLAKTEELAHYHWQRTYGLPTNVEFHRQVASYFIKDDHDSWQNDCWPTMKNDKMFQFTFEQGLRIFPQQVPMGPSTYRTFRWGQDLQIWLVEGRDFRSANPLPDGPGKTIWGAKQKAWFKKTVEASDATFRVLISPTPVVGPDRTNKNDNHANKGFTHEGNELRAFIAQQENMVVVCGDRHWQYMSIHPKSGVREYSCGPASDEHAGGWKQSNFVKDYHRYLKVIGGFLTGTVERKNGKAALTFRWHDVKGQIQFEDQLSSTPKR